MVSKARHITAIHEAGHAVVARKLGLRIERVTVRSRDDPSATSHSAAHAASGSDVARQIEGLEKDTLVALAGLAANRKEYPERVPIYDVLTDDQEDIANARNAICQIILLKAGRPIPAAGEGMRVTIGRDMIAQITETYLQHVSATASLVDQHWPIIKRVAKHLESHPTINGDELDELIDRTERVEAGHKAGR